MLPPQRRMMLREAGVRSTIRFVVLWWVLTVAHLQRTAGGVGNARAAATAAHHPVEPIAFLLEACHDRPFERTAARQLDAHWVDEASVDQDFVVDMRAGRHAGGSDEADHLALAYPLADFHALGEGRHVAVG